MGFIFGLILIFIVLPLSGAMLFFWLVTRKPVCRNIFLGLSGFLIAIAILISFVSEHLINAI